MNKVKPFLILTLATLATLSLVAKSYARKLTTAERKAYGQNNIIFYVPCDSEADCASSSSTADPSNPPDPSTPTDLTPADPQTPSGSGAALIASTAIAMSWPDSNGQCRNANGTYREWYPRKPGDTPCNTTLKDYTKQLTGKNDGKELQDCGKFVSAVLHNSVDSSFPTSPVSKQLPYLESSSKWTKVSTDGQQFSVHNLQPGDVLAFSTGTGGKGHILIYVGKQEVPCHNGQKCTIYMAEAGEDTYTPTLTARSSLVSPSTGEYYKVFRYTGN